MGQVITLAFAAFIASAVEGIEALTIVLAAGVTKGWKSAIEGTLCAIATLSLLTLAFGPTIVHVVPRNVLHLVIGTYLLLFGLTWLKKAVMRASGLKEKHDEDAIFEREVARLKRESGSSRDWQGFVTAFKGVFIEGLEVVVIVITLGASSRHLGAVSLGAGVAVLAVVALGLIVKKQLSQIPENAMKMVVGLMVTSFGTLWAGEGIGFSWPGSDSAVIAILAFYGLCAFLMAIYFKAANPQVETKLGGTIELGVTK